MLRSLRLHSGSRWARLLAVVLAGLVLGQVTPVQPLLSSVWPAQECQCVHHGVCPRNPEGPCTCDHSAPASDSGSTADPTATDGPVLKDCDGASPTALGVASPLKALLVPGWKRPVPFHHLFDPSFRNDDLSPQRMGDEVFRPPRVHAG